MDVRMQASASVEEDEMGQRSNNSPASSSSLIDDAQRPLRSAPIAMPHSLSSCQLRKTSAVTAACANCRTVSAVRSEHWVRLNVGGTYFVTTRTTLMRDGESFFCRLLQGDVDLVTDRDETGAFMIDRDAEYFVPVLNYLRYGKLVINKHVSEEGVLEEAEFYNLAHLAELVTARITKRDTRVLPAKTTHIYRVLQCQEEELPSIVSGMSDGWKFEQLVKGPHSQSLYSYGQESHSEFLCIVSKECEETANDLDKFGRQTDRVNALLTKARQM